MSGNNSGVYVTGDYAPPVILTNPVLTGNLNMNGYNITQIGTGSGSALTASVVTAGTLASQAGDLEVGANLDLQTYAVKTPQITMKPTGGIILFDNQAPQTQKYAIATNTNPTDPTLRLNKYDINGNLQATGFLYDSVINPPPAVSFNPTISIIGGLWTNYAFTDTGGSPAWGATDFVIGKMYTLRWCILIAVPATNHNQIEDGTNIIAGTISPVPASLSMNGIAGGGTFGGLVPVSVTKRVAPAGSWTDYTGLAINGHFMCEIKCDTTFIADATAYNGNFDLPPNNTFAGNFSCSGVVQRIIWN